MKKRMKNGSFFMRFSVSKKPLTGIFDTLRVSPYLLLCKRKSHRKSLTFNDFLAILDLIRGRPGVRAGALHFAAALTRTGFIFASPLFLSNMCKLTHVGEGGMTFAVNLTAQGADEVTCASHSDAAPPLLCFVSLKRSFWTLP